MFNRNIVLPTPGEETFFLWGPRQTGKGTLLGQRYPRSRWLDLLRADEFRRYAANPEFLRQEIEAGGLRRESRSSSTRSRRCPPCSTRCTG